MSEKWSRQVLTAEFLSDAHLGSGSGGGGIDALVARDRDGQPVIWASHVEGVLRDAARRLRGDDAASMFFGRGGGERQRAVFTSLYVNEAPELHIWRSAAREAFDNRAPKDDTLRAIEYVPKGTTFTGQVELPVSQLATLRRLVQEVESLGGGRSTGSGRVTLTLSEERCGSSATNTPTGRLVVLLRNLDPLCITATATPDNLIPSLAFMPGRALLGAIVAWLMAEGDREAAALLTSGKIVVSDALPLPCAPLKLDSVEVLPAPLSLQSEKPGGATGYMPWWGQPTLPPKRRDAFDAGKTQEKLKRPEADLFVYRENANSAWNAFCPGRRVRLRSGRADAAQVEPSLFAVEQIVEKTHFLAELQGAAVDMKKLADKLATVLDGRRWLRVGRSGAPVAVAKLAWTGSAARSTVEPEGRALLTLTSDLLVRDEFLRWRTALDEPVIEEILGKDILLKNSIQDSAMVHGFNGTSRMWRMPAAAIRRGSVFEVSGAGVAKLVERAAKHEWLGERTHEGFGRFRLDATLPGVTDSVVVPSEQPQFCEGEEEAIAAKTQEWFDAHKGLASAGSGTDRKPSLSQWFDLVSELDANSSTALSRRLNPTTAGGKSWQHRDAEAVLKKLQAAQPQCARHARLFVRWLRAEARKNAKEGS